MKFNLTLMVLIISGTAFSQVGPEITTWKLNLEGRTGYNNIPSDIQKVQYSDDYVYVTASGIPDYDIGPWSTNPNDATELNHTYKIPRNPVQNITNMTRGIIGAWANGVAVFKATDARSYENAGVWNRVALIFEGFSFDDCSGHNSGGQIYHHHISPNCLYNDKDSTNHSPIIGYAFDGYPIYGPYAYSNTDGTGSIKLMVPGYKLLNYTSRVDGPDVSDEWPLGGFIEDFEFVEGWGDLDSRNGRYAITPEYPNGTYAYYVTIDETRWPIYPFTIGPYTYYGEANRDTDYPEPTEPVINYIPDPSRVQQFNSPSITYNMLQYYADTGELKVISTVQYPYSFVNIYNTKGKLIYRDASNPQPYNRSIQVGGFSKGYYVISIENQSGVQGIPLVIK